MIRIALVLVMFSVGCSAGFETEGEFEASVEYETPSGGAPDEGTGGLQSDTGGDDQGGTGGDEQTSTGGLDGGTGGDTSTGGETAIGGDTGTADEDCFSQWDPDTEYVFPASVQVGDMIFELCAEESTIGWEPENTFYQADSCEGEWHYIADCPPRNCGAATDWDTSAQMNFSPPILAGTLFIYEGQIFETVSEFTTWVASSACPPNPEQEHWCSGISGTSGEYVLGTEPLVLAEHCL